MSNHNNSNDEFEVSSDSLAFACASRITMMKLNEVLQLVCKLLKWQRAAVDILLLVVIHIEDESDWVDFSHRQIGAWMFPALSDEQSSRRVMGCLKSLRMCQEESGFLALDIRSGKKVDNLYLPTSYRVNQFWPVVNRIQERVAETDALASEDPKRRSSDFRKVVREVIREFGFEPREASASRKRSQKQKDAEGENPYRLPWMEQAARFLDGLGEQFGTLVEEAEDYPPVEWLATKASRIVEMQLARKREAIARHNSAR